MTDNMFYNMKLPIKKIKTSHCQFSLTKQGLISFYNSCELIK